MAFRISGLDPAPFAHLFGLSDDELSQQGIERHQAGEDSGLPDRVELRDLRPGEFALLLNFTHQPARNPYFASHAIFIREGATDPSAFVDEIPSSLRARMLSLRAFDRDDRLIDADLVAGTEAQEVIERMLSANHVHYLHVHYARQGCYAARIDRTDRISCR
jgi:hypothetical protein